MHKPCPFCGKTESVVMDTEDGLFEDIHCRSEAQLYVVFCDSTVASELNGCGARGGARLTEAEAWAAWDRRTDGPKQWWHCDKCGYRLMRSCINCVPVDGPPDPKTGEL